MLPPFGCDRVFLLSLLSAYLKLIIMLWMYMMNGHKSQQS